MDSQNIRDRPLDAIIGEVIDGAERGYLLNPAMGTVEELVEVLNGLEGPPTIRLLVPESRLKAVMEDFLIASRAADLVDSGVLSIRLLDERPVNSLLVTDESVVSLVTDPETPAGLSTDDEPYVRTTESHYDEVWEAAESYSLRTPPLSRVRSTLEAALGSETLADFDAVLDSLETARGDGEGLDEVEISLLVAARNEQLLYDVSKWGEDVGLASKATFSRTKTRLEEQGLLTTEKVPIEVGRPRLRLLLGDERLSDAEADELGDVATKLLA